jgi:hypothetical protein
MMFLKNFHFSLSLSLKVNDLSQRLSRLESIIDSKTNDQALMGLNKENQTILVNKFLKFLKNIN